MKSLLDLPEAYLNPAWRACAVPGRPWWTQDAADAEDDVVRRLQPDGSTVSLWPGRASEYDARDPLPHPGFRAGQTWGILRPSGGFAALAIWQHSPNLGPMYGDVFERADEEGASFFLLHDPVRPDLAPWSSR